MAKVSDEQSKQPTQPLPETKTQPEKLEELHPTGQWHSFDENNKESLAQFIKEVKQAAGGKPWNLRVRVTLPPLPKKD
jgi:hypothetical protein